MSGGNDTGLWPAGGPCPLRRDRPVTCATLVAMREWLDISQKRFCGFFELGPATWAAIRRAAAEGGWGFPGGPPLVAAPYALIARWVVPHEQVYLPPLFRAEPADLYASLRRVLGTDAPGRREFALALGRDADAARAWLRDGKPGGAEAIVCLAATLLLQPPATLLAGRWRSWWRMAMREAALRGIPSLADAGSWQVSGRLVVPSGRWGTRLPLEGRPLGPILPVGGRPWPQVRTGEGTIAR